jgi:putative ABC transport system substrate-binding protein
MKRRTFMALVSGSLLAAPLTSEAQLPGKVWRIGLIVVAPASPLDALFQGLRELGYVEGQNLIIERRYSEGRAERFSEFTTELVRAKVDLIIVNTTPAAIAAKKATTTIPIVFPTAIDPVAAGVVASLARPGGNVTGLSLLTPELSPKRLELLKQVIPGLSRVAVLWNAANPANALPWRETQGAGRALGVVLQSREIGGPNDFEAAFALMAKEHPQALLVFGDALITQHEKQIVDFVTQKHIPSSFPWQESVVSGGLMSYGPSRADLYRRAAVFVDKIFKGAKPGDLPIEQPTKFELVINLKTAKALGLTIPPSLLRRADEVIQ